VILIIIVVMVAIVESSTVVMVIVMSWWVVGARASSHVFPHKLLGVVGICIIFGSGEKLSDHSRPFLE
jgi:hypothetical protein